MGWQCSSLPRTAGVTPHTAAVPTVPLGLWVCLRLLNHTLHTLSTRGGCLRKYFAAATDMLPRFQDTTPSVSPCCIYAASARVLASQSRPLKVSVNRNLKLTPRSWHAGRTAYISPPPCLSSSSHLYRIFTLPTLSLLSLLAPRCVPRHPPCHFCCLSHLGFHYRPLCPDCLTGIDAALPGPQDMVLRAPEGPPRQPHQDLLGAGENQPTRRSSNTDI